jgi:hypothetical protein
LDQRNDLVVLDVTSYRIAALNAEPYRPIRQWPPPSVKLGESVLICGFPAILRTDSAVIEHGDLSYFGGVESVSEFQFVVMLQGDLEDAGRIAFPSLNSDFGGLSGCPAFVLYSDHMQLVGIFCQSLESAPVWIIRSLAHLPSDLAKRPAVPV